MPTGDGNVFERGERLAWITFDPLRANNALSFAAMASLPQMLGQANQDEHAASASFLKPTAFAEAMRASVEKRPSRFTGR